MGLIRMFEGHCPYCGSGAGKCAIEVAQLDSLESVEVKVTEKSYLNQFLGKHTPREAYLVDKIICYRREKRSETP